MKDGLEWNPQLTKAKRWKKERWRHLYDAYRRQLASQIRSRVEYLTPSYDFTVFCCFHFNLMRKSYLIGKILYDFIDDLLVAVAYFGSVGEGST